MLFLPTKLLHLNTEYLCNVFKIEKSPIMRRPFFFIFYKTIIFYRRISKLYYRETSIMLLKLQNMQKYYTP